MNRPHSSSTVEHVLVVPTAVFHQLGPFQGFQPDADRYLEVLLDPAYTSFRPRDAMETDPDFKQLIPYCIFSCDGAVFAYTRSTQQGESRLHAKRSIGVGGHICTLDVTGTGSPYEEGLRRELEEEVHIDSPYRHRCLGLINDDSTDVGRVHLGIVHLFELDRPQVRPRERSMIDAGFVPLPVLRQQRAAFETWSQICLDHLAGML
ncbi:MAG: phosphoesterase [Planctomycetota bacterium]|nr:MAG: phosphoesterase [Planctomycetota bacterium]